MQQKFFFIENSSSGILILYKLKGDYWLDYQIFQAEKNINEDHYAVSQTSSIQEANLEDKDDQLISGFIKWDGCMQWYCPNNDMTFFHGDDRKYAKDIFNLIVDSIYNLAKEVIPTWDGEE